jgi:spore coat-associated protein N
MKKIILSFLTIIGVIAAATVATQAVFSDTETSNDNTFAAGTLNLTVNDHDNTVVEHADISNLYPGWRGYDGNGVPSSSIKWEVKNIGSLPGNLTVEFANVHNHDNTCIAPETLAGDTDCGDDQGEIGANLLLSTWKSPLGSHSGSWASGFHTFNQYSTQPWNLNGTITLGSGESIFVGLKLDLPSTVGNLIQTDSLLFDVVFKLEQTP